MAEQATEVPQRKGREGARWINERPTSDDFGKWAKENIKVSEDLSIEDYIGGIVLIPAVDKRSKYVAGFTQQGEPRLAERPEMVYVPYVKVETRLQYFWDLLESNEKWVGVIEPIKTVRPELDMLAEVIRDMPNADTDTVMAELKEREVHKASATAAIVHQLPDGFFVLPVPNGNAYTYFLCCSYRVAIYEKGDGADERPVREGRGTKQVALLGKGYNDSVKVDENAIMKAETGAIGRALGAAGIFNIPGSGIATAEDMLEAAAGGNAAAADAPQEGAGPAAPAEVAAPAAQAQQLEPAREATTAASSDDEIRQESKEIVATLKDDFPEAHAAFGEWCNKRRPKIVDLAQLEGPALRGVHTKLEKLLGAAIERQAERGELVEPPAQPQAVAVESREEARVPPETAEDKGNGPNVPPEGEAGAEEASALI